MLGNVSDWREFLVWIAVKCPHPWWSAPAAGVLLGSIAAGELRLSVLKVIDCREKT